MKIFDVHFTVTWHSRPECGHVNDHAFASTLVVARDEQDAADIVARTRTDGKPARKRWLATVPTSIVEIKPHVLANFAPELLAVGQLVECVQSMAFVGRPPSHVNFGVVERLTASRVFTRNEHGNACAYWRHNGLAVAGSGAYSLRNLAFAAA